MPIRHVLTWNRTSCGNIDQRAPWDEDRKKDTGKIGRQCGVANESAFISNKRAEERMERKRARRAARYRAA